MTTASLDVVRGALDSSARQPGTGCTNGVPVRCAIFGIAQGAPAMTRLNLQIDLPDALAKQAEEAGLLEPDAVERMVREALLVRRVDELARARDALADNPLPPMTSEEIQAEIDAYRAEVRRAARP
jgi:hypothetical protein